MGHLITAGYAACLAALVALPSGLAAQEAAAVQEDDAASEYVSPVTANAENIQRLNIMLMVTSLRCRQTAHDFQSEYDLFTAAHQQNLEEAHAALANDMVAEYGEAGTRRALDRIGVAMANRYGDGHPTLGCSDLKEVTLRLAMNQDRLGLSQMADDLLQDSAAAQPAAQGEDKALEKPPEIRPPYVPGSQVPHYGRG